MNPQQPNSNKEVKSPDPTHWHDEKPDDRVVYNFRKTPWDQWQRKVSKFILVFFNLERSLNYFHKFSVQINSFYPESSVRADGLIVFSGTSVLLACQGISV